MDWVKKAINDIKHKKISHRNWIKALSEVDAKLYSSVPGEVISITGPSRVGKSKLIKELSKMINEESNEDFMPFVSVLAKNDSVGGSFSTKSFMMNALEVIKHPMYGSKLSDDLSFDRISWISRKTESILRKALEQAFIYRKVRYFVIDEAQHIRYVLGGDKNAAAILDSWKCFAQDTGVVLILVGAYPLMEVMSLSPHLLGRDRQIHLPRYYMTNKDDLIAFYQILDDYSKYIEFDRKVSSLRVWAEFLYENSFGCIGLLEMLIRDALSAVMANGDKCLTLGHLQCCVKANKYKESIADEIYEGEEIIGVNKESIPAPIKKAKKKSKRKPFQKKPVRYRIKDSL